MIEREGFVPTTTGGIPESPTVAETETVSSENAAFQKRAADIAETAATSVASIRMSLQTCIIGVGKNGSSFSLLLHRGENFLLELFFRFRSRDENVVSERSENGENKKDDQKVHSHVLLFVGNVEGFRFFEILFDLVLSFVRKRKLGGEGFRNGSRMDRFVELEVLALFGRFVGVVFRKPLEADGFSAVFVEDLVSKPFPFRFEAAFGVGENVSEAVVYGNVIDEFFSDVCALRRENRFFSDSFEYFAVFVDDFDLSGRFKMDVPFVFKAGGKNDREIFKRVASGKFRSLKGSDFERIEVSGNLGFARNVDENEGSKTLDDRNLGFVWGGRKEDRAVMAPGFGARRGFNGKADFAGFAVGKGEVLVFDRYPAGKGEFVGSLVLRLDERRGSGVVSGDEVFLGSIERNGLSSVVGHLHGSGSFLSGLEGIFELQGRNADARGMGRKRAYEDEGGREGFYDEGNAHNGMLIQMADTPKTPSRGLCSNPMENPGEYKRKRGESIKKIRPELQGRRTDFLRTALELSRNGDDDGVRVGIRRGGIVGLSPNRNDRVGGSVSAFRTVYDIDVLSNGVVDFFERKTGAIGAGAEIRGSNVGDRADLVALSRKGRVNVVELVAGSASYERAVNRSCRNDGSADGVGREFEIERLGAVSCRSKGAERESAGADVEREDRSNRSSDRNRSRTGSVVSVATVEGDGNRSGVSDSGCREGDGRNGDEFLLEGFHGKVKVTNRPIPYTRAGFKVKNDFEKTF